MRIKRVNNTYFAIILLAAVLLLMSIPIARVTNNSPAISGSSHYDTLNHAPLLLDYLLQHVPHIILSISVPLILAIGSLIFFTMIIRKYVQETNQIYYALVILILTPTFINIHLGLHIYQFILFFGLLFAYLYLIKSKWFYVPLALMYLVDPLLGLAITFGLIITSFIDSKKEESIILGVFLLAMVFLSTTLFGISFSLSQIGLKWGTLFSFFNADYGYSLFLLVLGLGGLFFVSKRNIPLIIVTLSLFYEPLRILGVALLSYYAAISFHRLETREWTISFIKTLTLVLFVCILLFSSSTYIKERIQESPHENHVDALLFLNEVQGGSKVLSSKELSSFITFMTGQEVISSPNYFYSQNYNFISEEFKKNDIGYILIDSNMKGDDGIWTHDEQGLLFLLKYNDNFRKVYENDEVEIYYYQEWRE